MLSLLARTCLRYIGLMIAATCAATMPAYAQTTIAQHVAVPAYFYPDPSATLWTQMDGGAPAVGIAVANPLNGPNYSADQNYVSAIQAAHNAGLKVLGYVDSGYFGAPLGGTDPTRTGQTDAASWKAQVEADVDTWYRLYGSAGLDGIFFDDAQNVCGTNNLYVQLYSEIRDYVKQNHLGAYTVANPGGPVPQCLSNIADTLLTFEGSYHCYAQDAACTSPSAPYVPLAWNPVDPQKIWHAVFGAGSADLANASALSKQRNAGWVFLTDAAGPPSGNPYATLPSYLSTEDVDTASGGTADTTPPTPPDTLDTVDVTSTQATLNWGPSTDYNSDGSPGSGVVGYDVYQQSASGFVKIVSVPASANPQVSITGLTPATQYTYMAKARDAAGNISAQSNILTFTTYLNDGCITAPTALTARADYTDIVLSWTASQDSNYPVAAYDVFENGVKVLTVDATTTTATVVSLANATSYTFTVQGRDTDGDVSALSAAVSVSTLTWPIANGAPNPLANETVTFSTTALTYQADFLAGFGIRHVFIDADNNPATGFSTAGVGADYMIENNTLYKFAGASQSSFTWTALATINPTITGYTYSWQVPLTQLTGIAPATTQSLVFQAGGYTAAPYGYFSPIFTATQH